MQKPPQVLDVDIQAFSSHKGYGLAPLPQGGRLEVAHSVPGDSLRVEWRKKRYDPQKGRLLEILTPSPERTAPLCSHAGVCGGCCWQQVRYEAQLQEKMKRVGEAFENRFPIEPIVPCENPFGYRNKMEFSFSQNGAGTKFLGLMIAQAEPYVFNLSECHLGPSWFAHAVQCVRQWWETTSLQAYHPPKDTGSLRYLTLRHAVRTGEKMAVLNVSGHPDFAPSQENLRGFVQAINTAAQDVAIFLRIHQTKKGRPTQFFEMHLGGTDHILEKMHIRNRVFSFKISPISFFQPNTLQAEKLYEMALDALSPSSIVYDLYCGTGTLGMAASSLAQKVIGIELSPEAVLDAEDNIRRNQIHNMSLHQGDVGQVLSRLTAEPSFVRPDAVIVDPPRAGLDAPALHHLKILQPKKIIYISCNPLTQAENIKELLGAGYQLKRLRPIDQFPHTYHIENIAFLERNSPF